MQPSSLKAFFLNSRTLTRSSVTYYKRLAPYSSLSSFPIIWQCRTTTTKTTAPDENDDIENDQNINGGNKKQQQQQRQQQQQHQQQKHDDDDKDPPVPLAGQLKNPIVQKLWAARQQAKSRISDNSMISPVHNDNDKKKKKQELQLSNYSNPMQQQQQQQPKTPSQSQTTVSYPFSTDEFLLETYRNPWGQMRFGKLLEDLDALAGNIAFQHVDGNPLIVTAAVDRIRLKHQQPDINNMERRQDQHLSGKVTWVGSSSMEIRMSVEGSEDGQEWLEAYFTFVTLDPETKKPIKVNPIVPETTEERAHFELGALKANAKKQARRNRIQMGEQLSEGSLAIDKVAAALLKEAGPVMRMPSLAAAADNNVNAILMNQTCMQNAMIAQPQVRNLHDRIFGGFLMRRAYELAYATAYVFGGDKPRFLEVDDISFESPVDVGDLLVFDSRVLYTEPDGGKKLGDDHHHNGEDHGNMPLVMIEVMTWLTYPEECDARISNHFYFTFGLPNKKSCKRVLPGNIDEARRMATRMAADKEQASLRS